MIVWSTSWKKNIHLEEQQKGVTKVLDYEFEIIYKKGKQNVLVDALLRKEEDIKGLLCVISIIKSI